MKQHILFIFMLCTSLCAQGAALIAQLPLNAYDTGSILISADKPMNILGAKTSLGTTLHIAVEGHRILLNGKPFKASRLFLKVPQVRVGRNIYEGPIALIVQKNALRISAQKEVQSPEAIWGTAKPRNALAVTTHIKVLIDEKKHKKNAPLWTVESKKGFLVSGSIPTKKQYVKAKQITVSHSGGYFFIGSAPFSDDQIRIYPLDGYATIDATPYHGSFTVAEHKNKIVLINHVALEEYVYSVLKTESWPGWPIEVNKAFAIASRSYVLAQIHRNKSQNALYHVKNSNYHQTYKGMHTTSTIRKAVDNTKGMVLMYEGEPALAMFDSCCGGIIPAHIEDFEFDKAPYLARTQACTHCQRCWIYSWKKEIPISTVHNYLAHLFDDQSKIHSITVQEKDKAGLITKLHIKKGKSNHTIDGKKFYNALKEVKSFCYAIEKKGSSFVIDGKGYGHHLGLCQWGAREMVRDGWPYKRILNFYYPGTTICTT